MATLWDLMRDCIPDDHARQVTSRYYLDEVMTSPGAPDRVVDLGCGRGASVALFRRHDPKVRWVGVDIRDSPEARQYRPDGAPLVHFDGVRLPFRSDTVPLIYSHQVFEHVSHPRELLAEIGRVLRPGGLFIGSTSQFEPYHSFSLWNYTPYGFRVLVEEAGLALREIRPSLDGVTLIMRTYDNGRKAEYGRYWDEESPLNAEIDGWAKDTKRRTALVNLRKLTFCGQFAFRVAKPERPVPSAGHQQLRPLPGHPVQ
ncbi:class I SAM-dependent methyltransferase [Streptomyces spinoverrucosus]|uniref:class I SAM-dependent methyltransferase n=1 Tax=Streptomyces spinoverrucosus TaxID=284043 RepID=UPI0018C3B6F0|nr:class I SAM-dependent methyltransferase [Streptomyces spinoverrucosus]MBG0855556.1 class I SAM-dependent methyltransferase [Streptomyces spinoverrucosus]